MQIGVIFIGAIFFNDCPAQRYIPIYLIVGGCFGVVKNASRIIQRVVSYKYGSGKEDNVEANEEAQETCTNPIDDLLTIFLIVWFLAGSN